MHFQKSDFSGIWYVIYRPDHVPPYGYQPTSGKNFIVTPFVVYEIPGRVFPADAINRQLRLTVCLLYLMQLIMGQYICFLSCLLLTCTDQKQDHAHFRIGYQKRKNRSNVRLWHSIFIWPRRTILTDAKMKQATAATFSAALRGK